jgi:hypothetical protein
VSGANYEFCPGCDLKALYMGEEDVPDGVEVWHEKCLADRRAELLTGLYAEISALMADYTDPSRDIIALMPFAASLDQLMHERYGVTLPQPSGGPQS